MDFLHTVNIELTVADMFVFADWATNYNNSLRQAVATQLVPECFPKAEIELESIIRLLKAFDKALWRCEHHVCKQMHQKIQEVVQVSEDSLEEIINTQNGQLDD